MEKVIAPYEHDPQDLSQIWMAFSEGVPGESDWKPALRDTINGRRVIWVKYDAVPHGSLWVKDRAGSRQVVRE